MKTLIRTSEVVRSVCKELLLSFDLQNCVTATGCVAQKPEGGMHDCASVKTLAFLSCCTGPLSRYALIAKFCENFKVGDTFVAWL
eukprot:1258244-Amphidinium_carterae.1